MYATSCRKRFVTASGTPGPIGQKEGHFKLFVFEEEVEPVPDFTGDHFSIELVGGPYAGYTRAGYSRVQLHHGR